MKSEILIYIYRLVDAHGNAWRAATNEPAEIVQVYGLHDENHDWLHFESEAYHLKRWASENNLKYLEVQKNVEFEIPNES